MRKVRIDSLPKAQYGPPFLPPMHTLNPVEVKAKRSNTKLPMTPLEFLDQAIERNKQQLLQDGRKLKGLPGNPYTKEEAKAIADAEMERRRKEYQLQWEKDAYGVAEPTMGPIEAAIALAAFGPALAATLGTELLGTGLTLGNVVNPAFAAHGVYNFANPESDFRQAVSRYNAGEGDWRDIAFEGGLNALNFLGAKSLPGDIKNFGRAYENVATGNSSIPYAWKSPAVGLSQEKSAEMFKGLLNSGQLTPAERALIIEYQFNSNPFTGRFKFTPVDSAKRDALNNIIRKYELQFPQNSSAIATRRFNADRKIMGQVSSKGTLGANVEGSRINFGDRPTSFSAGIGVPEYGGAADRLVIPSRHLSKMKDNFIVNEYSPLSQEQLQLFEKPNIQEFASKMGTNPNLVAERELIGTGLDFKQIGKVKNDIGGFDYIVRPITKVQGKISLPKSKTSMDFKDFKNIEISPEISNLFKNYNQNYELDRAIADATAFSNSPANKIKLQAFRPGESFDVTQSSAKFPDDPEAFRLVDDFVRDEPSEFEDFFIKTGRYPNPGEVTPAEALGGNEGRYLARNYGDLGDVVLINRNSPTSYLDGLHEMTHSRSIRLKAKPEEKVIAEEAWKPMLNANSDIGMPAEEAFAVQNELRSFLNDLKGERVYTTSDIPEIKEALKKLQQTNHPYLKRWIDIDSFDMNALIKSLNVIGLGATVPFLINGTQQKKKGGSIYGLPKAKNGLPPKDYPIATPPPAWMPIYTLNPVEVKAKSTNNNNLPKGLPGNPFSQEEADAIAKEQEALRQRAYYKQFSERPQAIQSTLGPVEGAIALAAGAPALAATLGTELLGTGVTVGNIVNPLFAAHGAYNFANPESDFRQALSRYNQGEGDWRDVAFEGGLNALNFLGAKSLPGDIKALSNARALKLAKYNPWAWEPNANSFYHRNSNLENVVNPETGMLQSWAESAAGKAYTETNLNKTGLKFKKGAKGNMSFSKGVPLDGVYTNNKYPGPYLIEVSGETVPFRESVKGSPVSDVPGKIIGSYNVPGRPIALSEAKFYKEHPIWGYKPIEMPIQTPPGFQNRIFGSNVQLGEFKGIGHLSEPGYTYRTVGTEEIDAIRNTKGVFPRSGKAKGGKENVKYWTKGNGKNWYGENPEQQVIRVRDSKLLKDKVVNSKDVEIYNHSTGKFEPIHKKAKGGSLPKAQYGNPPFFFKYTEDNDDISMPWWDAPKENVGQGSSKQNEISSIGKIIQDQLRKDIRKAPRSQQIRYAVNQLKYMDPNYSPNLETLMNMTAWMENDYGTNPNAYGRDYTNSFMSLDDPAIDAIYIPRGQNTYNRSQRNVLDNLKKYGYANRDALVKALRNEDPIAAMLAARATYYLSPDPLPDMSNPEAVFKYFAKNYNHYGYRKHKSDEEAYAKFLKGWEKYGKKSSTSKSKMTKGGELPKAQFGYETFLDKEKNGPWEQNDPYLHNFSTVDVPENLSELPSYRAYTFAKGDLHPMTAFGHATSYDSGYTKFDNKTGYLYQPNTQNLQDFQSLPMEGDREFNLRRFVLNPYEGQQQTHDVYTRRDASGNIINDKENFIPKSYSKEETMDNVFKDLYGQNLYKFKGDRDAAYNATKEFMTNRVEPQYKGKYYEFMNNPDISLRDKRNISSNSKMTVYDDSAKDQLYQSFVDELYNPPFNPIASPSVKEALSPDPSKISKAVYENPKFKEKLDLYNDVLQDWYITNKHMTPEQAKSQVEGNLYKDTPWDKQKKKGGVVKKVKINSLPKAKNGLPPKDYPIATPPPAWMPIHTLNPVEVKANRFDYNIDTSKYPDLGINQPLPTFRPIRKPTLEEEIQRDKYLEDRQNFTPDKVEWYESFNPYNWGVNDYSNYSSFNSAFRNAREAGEKEFMFKGERYNTNLVDKKHSDDYWDQKNFLREYYKNEPFKPLSSHDSTMFAKDLIKDKHGTTWSEYYNKTLPERGNLTYNDKRYNEIQDSLEMLSEYGYEQDPAKRQELNRYIQSNLGKTELANLEEPYYFSMTNNPIVGRNGTTLGFVDPQNKKLFVSTDRDGNFNTTYVHELSHKGDLGDVYSRTPQLDYEILNRFNNGRLDQGMVDYLADPSEIEARKMSTLYYFKKNGLPYQTGKITSKQISDLSLDIISHPEKYPHDVVQLFQLFSGQTEKLLKYFNNDFSKKQGGSVKKVKIKSIPKNWKSQ